MQCLYLPKIVITVQQHSARVAAPCSVQHIPTHHAVCVCQRHQCTPWLPFDALSSQPWLSLVRLVQAWPVNNNSAATEFMLAAKTVRMRSAMQYGSVSQHKPSLAWPRLCRIPELSTTARNTCLLLPLARTDSYSTKPWHVAQNPSTHQHFPSTNPQQTRHSSTELEQPSQTPDNRRPPDWQRS